MKFKVGDKVIPKKFKTTKEVTFQPKMEKYLGKEWVVDRVTCVGYYLSCGWSWIEEALELVEEKSLPLFKVGDKVKLSKFKDSDALDWYSLLDEYLDKTQTIDIVDSDYTCRLDSGVWWGMDGLTLVEDAKSLNTEGQIFFKVGQEVYSPLFGNKERNGIVLPMICSDLPINVSDGKRIFAFTFDGKSEKHHDYISLFQNPIIFPENSPLIEFKEGEIVEASDDGETWYLTYYIGISDSIKYPHKVGFSKNSEGESANEENYAHIRKVGQTA